MLIERCAYRAASREDLDAAIDIEEAAGKPLAADEAGSHELPHNLPDARLSHVWGWRLLCFLAEPIPEQHEWRWQQYDHDEDGTIIAKVGPLSLRPHPLLPPGLSVALRRPDPRGCCGLGVQEVSAAIKAAATPAEPTVEEARCVNSASLIHSQVLTNPRFCVSGCDGCSTVPACIDRLLPTTSKIVNVVQSPLPFVPLPRLTER